jgi:riboflavin kinase/FMN adenylyltransferase
VKFVRGLYNLPSAPERCAATIGNFDGVHLGHQAILKMLSDAAHERGLPVTLIIFEPQPLEFFVHAKSPARLSRCSEKLAVLKNQPIDRVVMLHFNETLAHLSAENFIHEVLVDRLNVQYLLIGDDFRFGRGREGDFELLKTAANDYGFELHSISSVLENERRISSTLIRQSLEEGDFEKAAQYLGRPYTMSGKVVYGDAIGRDIGFPTINIPIHREHSPVAGIYAVRVHGVESSGPRDGVASVGTRPTVDGQHFLLEVHLFDWSGNLYGKRVEVEFVKFLRAEEKYPDIETLRLQIERDAEAARKELET